MEGMTSSRPYLIRAFYDWIVDNGLTPCILVNATMQGVCVPEPYVHDGRIVLNVGPTAVDRLDLGNDWIRFSARFSGTSYDIEFPPASVLAIYSRENGRGMAFGEEDSPKDPPETDPDDPKPKKGPALRIVK